MMAILHEKFRFQTGTKKKCSQGSCTKIPEVKFQFGLTDGRVYTAA